MSAHTAAVFFSLDCVLVRGGSLSRTLEERLGLSGPLSLHETAETDAARWAGFSETALHTQLTRLPLLPGVAETTHWCWGNGLVPVISSLTWAPIGAHLADRFGVHSYFGCSLETADGRFTGKVGNWPVLTDEGEFARRRADELGVPPQDCAAVGACSADGALFDSVGLGIAFNTSPHSSTRATTSVRGDDLRAVIPALKHLTATGV
ncbi:haloacid dehalogenase [Streptomyces hirsutus]|uniref:Haloacid dehalogenase n=1 Tax=Streptomyces hirsutus TaxID=35620 RepID=A0ABZ1GW70_9ACTN|nr:haloacid dehalogenase [Streptomyces hirsutus]WSD10417.1 haloacid dehalogenase [Streptomyces hirsutus]WTD16235.1 haloacid dehalogenase [Streptomyces hirsutus]WTD78992.1 haloacid dehalogenase [Streptomyces sp. NBC_01635]